MKRENKTLKEEIESLKKEIEFLKSCDQISEYVPSDGFTIDQ
eukprot:gene6682-10847_t